MKGTPTKRRRKHGNTMTMSWIYPSGTHTRKTVMPKGLAFQRKPICAIRRIASDVPESFRASYFDEDNADDIDFPSQEYEASSPQQTTPPLSIYNPRRKPYAEAEKSSFDHWKARSASFVEPLASYLNQQKKIITVSITCNCSTRKQTKHRLILMKCEGVLDAQCCKEHLLLEAIRKGLFPATPKRPQLFFEIDLLQLFHQLWQKCGISTTAFSEGILQFHFRGTSDVPRYTTALCPSELRKQFGDAYRWYRKAKVDLDGIMQVAKQRGAFTRMKDIQAQHTEGQSLDMLARRCPPCFHRLNDFANAGKETANMLELIVSIDGNFQHKRRRIADACKENLLEPRIMLPRKSVEAMQQHVAHHGAATKEQGCLSDYKAAKEEAIKASTSNFDITGLMMLSCQHDIPLFACDIFTPGERQFYALALLKALFDVIGSRVQKIGVLYDIACTSSKYIKTYGLVPEFASKIQWATSIFHSYGHDFACQMGYNPRYVQGFGLSDGEGNERLWSSLSSTIAKERSMTAANRNLALESRMHCIGHDKVVLMANNLSNRMAMVSEKQQLAMKTLVQSEGVLLKCKAASSWTQTSPFQSMPVPQALKQVRYGKEIYMMTAWRTKVEVNKIRGRKTRAELALDRTLDLELQIKACEEQIKECKITINILVRNGSEPTFGSDFINNLKTLRNAHEKWEDLKLDLLTAQADLSPLIFTSTNAVRVSTIKLARIASDLCAALSYYHMDMRRLRSSTQYPLGTTLHQSVMAGLKARNKTVKRLHQVYTIHASLQHNQRNLDPSLRFPAISEEVLFHEDTMQLLHRLGAMYGESEAPWRLDLDIQDMLNAACTVLRCDEEMSLLKREAKSLNDWTIAEANRLSILYSSQSKDSPWSSLLQQDCLRLQACQLNWKKKWNDFFDAWRELSSILPISTIVDEVQVEQNLSCTGWDCDDAGSEYDEWRNHEEEQLSREAGQQTF